MISRPPRRPRFAEASPCTPSLRPPQVVVTLKFMATTKHRRTTAEPAARPGTKPLTAKQKQLRASLGKAREIGEDPAGVVYEAMDAEAKRAFVMRRAK
jgi:hypothetical protein